MAEHVFFVVLGRGRVASLLLLYGLFVMSQSFIHFWKTSVVMCSSMFQVAQKSLTILPDGVDTIAFQPVDLPVAKSARHYSFAYFLSVTLTSSWGHVIATTSILSAPPAVTTAYRIV